MESQLSATRADSRSQADTSGKRKRFKRSQYFIAPEIQFRMAIELVLLWLVGAALAVVNLYVLYELSDLYESDALRVGAGHWEENLMVWIYAVVSLVIGAVIFLLACVYYSHRIAGPARKLKKHIREMIDGDLTRRMGLRKNDHLHDLAHSVNTLTRKYHDKVTGLRGSMRRLRQAADLNDMSAVIDECKVIEDALADYNVNAEDTMQ